MKFINDYRGYMDASQQHLMYALAFFDEMIVSSYTQLLEQLEGLDLKDIENVTFNERVRVLSLTWQIVEALENVRQLVEVSEFKYVNSLNELSIFLTSCNTLRRKKGHVAQLLKNIDNQSSICPLMGILKWTIFNKQDNHGDFVDIALLSCDPFPIPPAKVSKPIVPINVAKDSFPAKPGISNVCLIAFKTDINISKAVEYYVNFSEEVDQISQSQIDVLVATGKLGQSEHVKNSGYTNPLSCVFRAKKK